LILYLLNNITFDTTHRLLALGEHRITLEPKVHQLLCVLVEAKGELVSRDKLIDKVWQGRVVGEGAINRTVSLLRGHFSSLDDKFVYIETLPKAGYKLVAAISEIPEVQHDEKLSEPSVKPLANEDSIAACSTKTQKLVIIQHSVFKVISAVVISLLLITSFIYFQFEQEEIASSKGNVEFYQKTPVTSFTGLEYGISTNTSGSKLLFHKRSVATQQIQLWIVDNNTNKKSPITDEKTSAYQGKISPNGESVVFAVLEQEDCQVKLLSLLTLKTEFLFECGRDSVPQFSWRNDSQSIFYRQRVDKTQPYSIFVYPLNTKRQAQITLPIAGGNLRGDHVLAHHPSENKLAVIRYISQDESELRIIESQSHQLLSTEILAYDIHNISWHPDGNALLFSSGEQLISYDFLTKKTQSVAFLGESIQSFSLVQSEQKTPLLYYSVFQSRSSIWVKTLDNSQPDKPWQASSKLDLMPRLANLSDQALFLSNRNGKLQLWLKPESENEALPIKMPWDLKFTRVEWSPNDSKAVFSKHGAVYSIDIPSKDIEQILPKETKAYVVNFGRNSNQLIYSSEKSGQWQLWLKDLHTKEDRQLTQNGGYHGRIYHERLIYSKISQDGLWQKPLTGGEESLLLNDFDKTNWLNWHIRGEYLYYYKPTTGVWQYHLKSEHEKLILPIEQHFVHQYHVSVDGKQLYFVKRGPEEGDIYKIKLSD